MRTRPRSCSVVGCDRAYSSRGWCQLHYNRWYRTGTVGTSNREHASDLSYVRTDAVRQLGAEGYDLVEIAACRGYYRLTDVARHYGLRPEQVSQIWRGVDPGEAAIPNIVARPQPSMLRRDVEILVLLRGMTHRQAAVTLGISANYVGRVLADLGYTAEQARAVPFAASTGRVNRVGSLW